MRPVERGACPTDDQGNPVVFKNYQDARPILSEERIGPWCSYCEMPIHNQAAVEHLAPKSKNVALRNDWDNFLLSCASCNSTKGTQNPDPKDLVLPDRDNTFRAFDYRIERDAVFVDADRNLPVALAERAKATRNLTGLHRIPGGVEDPTDRDVRWRRRNDALGKALRAKANLAKTDTPELRASVLDTAHSSGFFSVWMTVFAHDAQLRLALVQRFVGTAVSCFDGNGDPVARPNGAL